MTGTDSDAVDPVVHARRWWILATVLTGLFAVNVTITILAVSIHRIASEFNTTEATMTWVVTGPLLAFGVVGPLVGKLGDRYGHKRLFLLGMVGVVFTAVASAVAWSAGSLIAFRVLGAVEGAATGPASFAIVSRVFSQRERVKALGYWTMVGAGGPVVGVVAGGPLVEAFGWRVLFLLQIPIAVVAFVLALRLLPETPRHRQGRLDLAGAGLLALGVAPLLFAVSEATRLGWTDPTVVAGLVISPLALVGFVRVERTADSPLLPLPYLRRRGFTFAIVTQATLNAAYMGSFILTPLLLQNVLGYSETRTGLVSIARPLAFSIAGPLAAVVSRRVGARWAATGGAVGVVAAMGWMATLGESSTAVVIMGALALAGVGMGIAMPPLSASVTASVEPRDLGIAGAAQQMVNQVGVVVGITVMQMVQQSRVEVVGQAASYRWGYLTGLVLAAGAVLTAPRIVAATSARVVFEGGEGSPSPVDAITDAAPVADPIP
ncbi:MAG: MFS transporter [Microthrixaceae bacterium]|nr:MFS transporter [Acidimicrobiales bacterium]MCB9403498.1 MFS transporter [Microthrixaceae bacterium]